MTDLADRKRKVAAVLAEDRPMAKAATCGDSPEENLALSIDMGCDTDAALVHILRYREAIEAAARPRWIACAERMPLTGLTVIVDGGCAFFDGLVWRSMMGFEAGKQIQWAVTHWMPLPPPPEGTL